MTAYSGLDGTGAQFPRETYPEGGDQHQRQFPEADFDFGGSTDPPNSLLARSLRLVLGDVTRSGMPDGGDNPHARRLRGATIKRYETIQTYRYTNKQMDITWHWVC